jgi:hypothetical protein
MLTRTFIVMVSTARISLDGSQRYLVTRPLFDEMGFVAHMALQVLLCRKCGSCFIPNDVAGHARNCQSFDSKSINMQEFDDLCDSLLIHMDTQSVVHPSPRGPPVEGIKPPELGWACTVDPAHCAYCCCSLKGMQNHVRSHTTRPPNVPDGFHSGVYLQTLFPTFGIKYFEVEPALRNISIDSPLTRILQTLFPNVAGQHVYTTWILYIG